MPPAQRYYASYDKPPFCFAVAWARTLPGPILVDLMTRLDLTVSANKSVLNRMVEAGHLEVSKVGRVGRYALAGRMKREFDHIARHGEPSDWDGGFHVLIYEAPNGLRAASDRFRSEVLRRGYRTLRPGVLVNARDETAGLAEQMQALGVSAGRLQLAPDAARDLASRCWGLAELSARGDLIADDLASVLAEGHPGSSGEEVFRRLHAAQRPVVGWTLDLTDLPSPLMPEDWPGARIGALMGELFARHLPQAHSFAREVIAASPHGALAELIDAETRA